MVLLCAIMMDDGKSPLQIGLSAYTQTGSTNLPLSINEAFFGGLAVTLSEALSSKTTSFNIYGGFLAVAVVRCLLLLEAVDDGAPTLFI